VTQRDRVAHMLRAAGSRGVHTHELRAAYIANPSERIRELQDCGWVIEHTRERLHGTAFGTRYVKVFEPDVDDGRGGDSRAGVTSLSPATSPAPAVVVSTGQLFDREPRAPRNPYEYESEAA
jgi:hypothetical protein